MMMIHDGQIKGSPVRKGGVGSGAYDGWMGEERLTTVVGLWRA